MAIRRIELLEVPVKGKRLGRHVLHDERSKEFPAKRAGGVVSVKHASVGLPLDQDLPVPLGSCTANALCGALNSQPNSTLGQAGGKVYTETDAISLYQLETKLEGKPYPPNDPGGTGLEVCKAAKQLGWITAYHHAFGLQHALEALVLRPVIFGIAWLTSFDHPDQAGLVKIAKTARVRGGHEIVADEINAEQELVGFWNSWGAGWGNGGRFYMRFNDLGTMLEHQGDATVPVVS